MEIGDILKYTIPFIIIIITMYIMPMFFNYSEEYLDRDSLFVCVETTSTSKIVYHKETKVMYTVSTTWSSRGIYTMLVDEDGNPMIWEEQIKEVN